MSSFHQRKVRRSEYYFRFVFGWRQRPCSSCAGAGKYDSHGSPYCGACDGSGRELFRGPKAMQP